MPGVLTLPVGRVPCRARHGCRARSSLTPCAPAGRRTGLRRDGTLVERFDRRGTEPFELFTSEFGHNPWNPKKTTKSTGEKKNHFDEAAFDPKYKKGPHEWKFSQNSGICARKFNNFRKFQHFLNYRRNSDKISSKSEQKSMKRIQK